jgi:hypothetical protein
MAGFVTQTPSISRTARVPGLLKKQASKGACSSIASVVLPRDHSAGFVLELRAVRVLPR